MAKKRKVKVSGYSRITRVSPKTAQVTRVKSYKRQRPAKPQRGTDEPTAVPAATPERVDEDRSEAVKDCCV